MTPFDADKVRGLRARPAQSTTYNTKHPQAFCRNYLTMTLSLANHGVRFHRSDKTPLRYLPTWGCGALVAQRAAFSSTPSSPPLSPGHVAFDLTHRSRGSSGDALHRLFVGERHRQGDRHVHHAKEARLSRHVVVLLALQGRSNSRPLRNKANPTPQVFQPASRQTAGAASSHRGQGPTARQFKADKHPKLPYPSSNIPYRTSPSNIPIEHPYDGIRIT